MIDQAVRNSAALGPPGPRLPRLAPPVDRTGLRPVGALGDGQGVDPNRGVAEMLGAVVDEWMLGPASEGIGGIIEGILSWFSS
ncbi:hypothetical protein [Kitasatospora sp. NPDC058218]|uniref:hypothetical protein n=1 Tax=Kitasatospora sp. NPDC058218 TaxID=3346385 RepID=UPI0036DB9040